MTTANHPAAMPIVHSRPTFVEIHRRAGLVDVVTMFATGQPDVDAAEIRGCIADAYRTGLADGLARAERVADAITELERRAAVARATAGSEYARHYPHAADRADASARAYADAAALLAQVTP